MRRHASRTAVIYAFFRAIEDSRPAQDRLFDDPHAKMFLTKVLKMWILLSTRSRFFRWFVPWYVQLRWPGSLSSVVARTRKIDDLTRESIEKHDVYQVVILGAGYDTRAWRLAHPKVQFVEVDRPMTQTYKTAMLQPYAATLPVPVDYIEMDFKTQLPEKAISKLLLQEHYKTLIIWEGAVNNLTASLGNKMFRYFQEYPSGTRIIFNYVDKKMLDNPRSFYGATRVARMLKKMKEQWDTGLTPATLPHFLANYNMELLYDENATTYRELYASGSRDHKKMRGYEFLRLAMAVLK
ncbi:class I SAM-dependent methyltransferase [Chitinophaga agrisoli]|uniref:S-adenosyl-L-methionine-dependent methyltransferase n=1 Tax=Chitinophaga agrisoli TaxID=2607653 RepID=A0A5B2VSK2_9BACT|nr:class I SAM-dependent methyltransferase [Chitinophaga agrisoli]KAA2241620.1 class I SAM-dependent methyltransferase [Chitinophaga agrisoli]